MKRFDVRVIGGLLLVIAGFLFLLESLGIYAIGDLAWPLLFGAGGLVFLYVFLTNRENWWAVIPGFTLLGLAGLIAWDALAPESLQPLGVTFFLGGMAASFWVIFLVDRENWWAVIPGGVLLTTALVVGFSSIFEGIEVGGIFLLGLALTFGLLSLLRTPEGRMGWALIPAAVMGLIGVLLLAAAVETLAYLWPAALILGGLYLLFRSLRAGGGGGAG